jgi:hypothetical protein
VPGYLLFRRFGLLRWWQVTLAGAAIGCLVPLAIALAWMTHSNDLSGSIILFTYGIGLGALSGIIFWVVAVRQWGALRA